MILRYLIGHEFETQKIKGSNWTKNLLDPANLESLLKKRWTRLVIMNVSRSLALKKWIQMICIRNNEEY